MVVLSWRIPRGWKWCDLKENVCACDIMCARVGVLQFLSAGGGGSAGGAGGESGAGGAGGAGGACRRRMQAAQAANGAKAPL